jgi:hypothetical protein
VANLIQQREALCLEFRCADDPAVHNFKDSTAKLVT